MNSGNTFTAPWSDSLKLITFLSVAVLVSMPVFGLINFYEGMEPGIVAVLFLIPITILVSSMFFIIRSYEISNGVLHIQRPGWQSKIDLRDLVSVEIDPQAMKSSIRTFGNGGLFCFAGKFRNRKLGAYRAFATNPKLAVVLRFPDRTLVVTPGNPTEFKMVLERRK